MSETLALTERERDLVALHVGRVAFEARCLSNDPAVVADLVSVGHEALCRAVGKYDPTRGASFATFAGLVVRRRMLSSLKQSGRSRSLETQMEDSELETWHSTGGDGVETRLDLLGYLDRLEPRLRDVVLAHCFHGLTFGEISHQLGFRTRRSAWVLWSRALDELRQMAREDFVAKEDFMAREDTGI